MRVLVFSLVALVMAAGSAFAQGRSLEGTTVTVKMDMPASSDGVDVYPDGGGVDFRKVADRLKEAGIGVHNGDAIMITKVILKKDRVEVQLGGGGWGTFADRLAASASTAPAVPYETKSRREKDLEHDAKYSDDYWERRRARGELKDERNDRNRDNAMAAMINAQNRQAEQVRISQQRAQAGSRFNIRYRGGLPEGAATPRGIMDALRRYVDFGDGAEGSFREESYAARPSEVSSASLHKGLTVAQVEKIYGPATRVNQENEGSIEVSVREYDSEDGQRVSAKFVGGVLVDYRIGPK